MTPQEYMERIMTLHWDMFACPCEVCKVGQAMGWGAREQYLPHREQGAATKQEGEA